MTSPSDLTISPIVLELLASRICHDLISPVGAIHNGVEFMEDAGPDGSADALELIAHSAGQAAARLQLFRLVYGAGGRDGNIKPEDVKKAFGALVDPDGKVKQDWDAKTIDYSQMPLGFCKLLAGGLILAQEALPKGGKIGVTTGAGGEILITATGTDANIRAGVTDALERKTDPATLDARLVHPYVIGVLAAQYGFKVSPGEQAEGRVTYRLQKA